MSPVPRQAVVEARRFPRVSGDEPWQTLQRLVIISFSPRERG